MPCILFFVFVCLFIIIIIILEALVRQKERKKINLFFVRLVLTEPIQTGFDRTNTTNFVIKKKWGGGGGGGVQV